MLLSFIALVLIIKIIKIKLFWLLPIVIGVGAAKKLLLKFLLFLFPALTHLFKLCSYYQQSYHGTKYHHHQHHINHHHTVGATVRDAVRDAVSRPLLLSLSLSSTLSLSAGILFLIILPRTNLIRSYLFVFGFVFVKMSTSAAENFIKNQRG